MWPPACPAPTPACAPPPCTYSHPPGTGRDFYSGRAPLPPPFGAGPAGQTDGRTDLLPKHNSTSSPERRTSTRRINATLDRTWSVRLMYPMLGPCHGGAGMSGGWLPSRAGSQRQGRCRYSAGNGSRPMWPQGRALPLSGRTSVPFCKRVLFHPKGPAWQAKLWENSPKKQLAFVPWQVNRLCAWN